MAYTSGDTILDDHYNDFATSVNAIWGAGTGDAGYGQSTTVSSVSAGATITAAQWATLLSRMTSIGSHQGTSITSISNPSAGDTIAAYTALASNIATLTTARLSVHARDSIATTAIATTTTLTGTIEQRGTWAWGSTDQARYFFNAGGRISISWALSGHTSDSKANNWAALATACGTYQVTAQASGKSGGSGSTNINGTNFGWHDLTGSYQTVFRQYEDTGPYTASYIQLDLYKSNESVLARSYWVDGAADQTSYNKSIYNVQDQVDGTKTTTMGHEEPTTTHISDTWGNGPSQTVNATG
jgi:hypothetical protein|tara:strand:- start:440 stop:1339 length:900 start_codon:yes stop_codon:yes gene_type:complete